MTTPLPLALLLGLLPAFLWLWYVYTRDIYEREPKRLVLSIFLWGGAATVPAILLESLTGTLPLIESGGLVALGIGNFLLIGPIEEGCKFLVVKWKVYHRPEFNEPMDGIVYGASASLGFSAVENVFYILTLGPGIALLRALLSSPLHFTVGAMWGAALGQAKFRPGGGAWLVAGGLLAASAFHGGFDFLLTLQQPWSNALALLVLVPVLWWTWFSSLRGALAASPFRPTLPCSRCHGLNPRNAQFCTACGAAMTLALTACPACQRPAFPTYEFCPGCGARLLTP